MLVLKNDSLLPAGVGRLYLRNGSFSLVDAEDLDRLQHFSWFLLKSASTKYVVTRKIINGKTHTIRLHRFLINAPSSMKVHHINHDSLDNRKSNLRLVTEREHRHFDGWHIFKV